MRPDIFENDRIYDDNDTELDVIAPRNKRAQWRHRRVGPNFLRFGRRIKYHGADLNAWIQQALVVNENPTP
jgi:hypothetical protein